MCCEGSCIRQNPQRYNILLLVSVVCFCNDVLRQQEFHEYLSLLISVTYRSEFIWARPWNNEDIHFETFYCLPQNRSHNVTMVQDRETRVYTELWHRVLGTDYRVNFQCPSFKHYYLPLFDVSFMYICLLLWLKAD